MPTMDEEVARLRELLEGEELSPGMVQHDLAAFTAAARDELVRRLAHGEAAAPGARLLARLPFIRTPENAGDMIAVLHAGLGSPDAEARQASLYNLEVLQAPELVQAAARALDDEDDAVLAAAADIILRRPEAPAELVVRLRETEQAHRGETAFRETLATLQSHGIGSGPPAEPGDEVA